MKMRSLQIAMAVATALGAHAASATDHHIYVSGASAQRAFWRSDLANICGTGSTVKQYAVDTSVASAAEPDLTASYCVANANAIAPVVNGDTVTMHYAAELGSGWGVLQGLKYAGVRPSAPATRLFMNPNTSACTAPNGTTANSFLCAATGSTYDYNSDSITGTATPFFAQHAPDLLVADIEPNKWAFPANWPTYTPFGALPSTDELNAVAGLGGSLIGQVFGVVTSTAAASSYIPASLSRASISSIFQGQFTTWDQVPEVGAAGAGHNIYVCRRDAGSGTQVSAQIAFVGAECGLPFTHAFVTTADQNNLAAAPGINNTGSLMAGCIAGGEGRIGFASLATNSSYKLLAIDGVQANAHNSAAGYYPFAYETWGANVSGSALGDTFINRIKTNSTLNTVLGGESVYLDSAGHFVTSTAAGVKVAYSLQAGNTPSIAALTHNATTNSASPVSGTSVSIFDHAGESCTVAGASGY